MFIYQPVTITGIPKVRQRSWQVDASTIGHAVLYSDPSANFIRFKNKWGKELEIRLSALKNTRTKVQIQTN